MKGGDGRGGMEFVLCAKKKKMKSRRLCRGVNILSVTQQRE